MIPFTATSIASSRSLRKRSLITKSLPIPKVCMDMESGYYDERYFVIRVVGDRPMNEQELAAEKQANQTREERDRKNYEDLKKRFEKKDSLP